MYLISNALPPLAAIPYIRTAILKDIIVAGDTFQEPAIRDRIDEKCRMLCEITNLRTVKTESAQIYFTFGFSNDAFISNFLKRRPGICDQETMSRLLQPFLELPRTCRLQKGNFCDTDQDLIKVSILETFSSCLDAVMALRTTHPESR